MGTKRVKLSEQVRRAVKQCGLSRYRICKVIGMDQSIMSRFMTGKGGLSMANLDALADVLGLRIVANGPTEAPQPGKPGRKPKAKKGG